jgi:hypothetical protein
MKNRLRKALIAAAMALPVATAGLLVSPTANATSPLPATARTFVSSNPPAIFLSPHQDDESLTMGAAIRDHVLAGRTVYVVLLTDGGSSGVCDWDPFYGDKAACTAERDKEFTNAVTKMGATPIIPTFIASGNSTARAVDGSLTGTFTANVIRYLAGVYGTNTSFKTMSEYDSISADHAAAGRGLYAAYLWGYIGTGASTGDARWYVRRIDEGVHPGNCGYRHDIDTALDYYYPVAGDPASGVGFRSVGNDFRWAYNDDAYYGPAAWSKVFTPAQRVPNGGSYTTCHKAS